ncbi:MAG: glycosyltransferase family 1 protein [Proteobacteria bacterium]|nr:MAG: glycosyltransferase family 1 protein [Pseudomonadota bacterium]
MRYCFVLPHFDETRNSFSKLLAPLVNALLKRGDKVLILSGNDDYSGVFAAIHTRVPGPRLKPAFLDYFRFIISASLWLKKRRKDFDLIHNLGVGASLVQDVMTAHAVHRSWIRCKWQLGQYFSIFANPLHAMVLSVEALNYSRNIPVIAVIDSLANEIREFYPAAAQRIRVIPNGIPDAPLIRPEPRLDASSFIISFASNDHRKKGLGELIEALSLAKSQGLKWKLMVLGHDPRQAIYEAMAKDKAVGEEVVFAGHVQNIRDHMASSDIFALPSHYEPFGLVYLEAVQAGLAVVGTNVGVYPNLVGERFKELPLKLPLSSQELFEVLRTLEREADFRTGLRAENALRAPEYTEEKMVQKTLAFYDQYLRTKGLVR